jgi:uncharacterized protein (TIGR02266 family)
LTSKKVARRILKDEILDREFDQNLEEAKTLKDVERLEKKDSQLWFLGLFLILILILWALARDLETVNLSPREFWDQLTSFRLSALIFPAAILILGFCAYLLFQNRSIRTRRREIFLHKMKMERAAGSREEILALFQVSSGAAGHKEPIAILEMIARESLGCLKAHRSTLFLADEKSGVLKPQSTRAFDPLTEQVGLFEEKEVARKALRQKKPYLLREPGDFSEFLKYEERERKITSLMSVPLFSQGRVAGVLSVAIIDEERKFTEKDLQFLMTLSNLASLAMENSNLQEEVRKAASFRKNYEQYLDHILNQLESLSDVERKRIEDHIGRLLPAQSSEGEVPLADQEEVVKGATPAAEQIALDRQGEDRTPRMLRVELDGEPLALTQDLGDGGVFIQTPNPLDLGEQFVLTLHLAEGEEPVEATCKVIWSNKYGKESKNLRRGMGVKFLNLPPEVQSRVEGYIRSHKDRQFSIAEDEHPISLEK